MEKSRASFITKELSKRTWPDFERIFSQGNGWDFCMCTHAQLGHHEPKNLRSREKKKEFNRKVKRDLVELRRAHGILVYDGTEPIGWCNFGPVDELPITDRRRKSKLFPEGSERIWRITCFITHKQYRAKGVTGIALGAALEAIQKRGGGVVEAFPRVSLPPDRRLNELIKEHGGESAEVRGYITKRFGGTTITYYGRRPFFVDGIFVQRVGPVAAAFSPSGELGGSGTVSTFEKEGFKAVRVLEVAKRRTVPGFELMDRSRVVMQKTI